jgi:hypothetical protein
MQRAAAPAAAAVPATGEPLLCVQRPQHQTWQQRNVYQPPGQALSAQELTKRIKHASAAELLQLHSRNRQALDDIHVSAFLSRLANLSGSSSGWPGTRQSSSWQQQQHESFRVQPTSPQQGWQQQQQQHLQLQQQLLAALLTDLQRLIPAMRPRAVASCLWALSKLQLQPPPQLLQMLLHRASHELGFSSFEPRQLCIIAYALVQLQEQGLYSVKPKRSSSSRGQLYGPGLLDDLYTALGAGLSSCSAHDIAQAVYALARLQHVPPPGWLAAWLQHAQQLLPQFTAQGLANAAYGLAAVMWQAGHVTVANSSSSSGSSRSTRALTVPQQQQQLLAAARAWLQACLRVSLLHLPFLQPSELFGQLLWAAGKLRCPLPQPAGHHLLLKTQTLLPACNAAHLSLALYSFAGLHQTPTQSWLRCYWQRVGHELAGFSALHLARMLWAAEVLKLQLPEGLGWRLQQRVKRMVAHAGEVKHLGRWRLAARLMQILLIFSNVCLSVVLRCFGGCINR